jgi:hypothetical protein
VLDQIVDDPALQFERDDFEQKDADCQRQQQKLVETARTQHIEEDTARQRTAGFSPFRASGRQPRNPTDDAGSS